MDVECWMEFMSAQNLQTLALARIAAALEQGNRWHYFNRERTVLRMCKNCGMCESATTGDETDAPGFIPHAYSGPGCSRCRPEADHEA